MILNNVYPCVLLCSYNGEFFLEEQVNSIFNQSIPISKLYICDFGSNDNTVNIIHRLLNVYSDRISFFSFNPLMCASHSFIKAIQYISQIIPSNSILYICDQDDYWLNDKNEVVLSNMYESDLPLLLHHDVYVVDDNLQLINQEFYPENIRRLILNCIPHRFFFNSIIGHTICMNYYSVKYLASINFDKRIIMHDWLWGALLEGKGRVIYLNKKLSFYRQHNFNIVGVKLYKSTVLSRVFNSLFLTIKVSNQLEFLKSLGLLNKNKIRLILSLIKYGAFRQLISVLLILILSLIKEFRNLFIVISIK